jgi:hypothetical protein
MPMRSAVKNAGIADGSRTNANRRMRPAPMLRSSRVASLPAAPNPSMSPTASGKNVTSATTSIFGQSPNPNQITTSGAIAITGIVCDATSSGVTPCRSVGKKSATTAISHAHPSESAKPAAVTPSVESVCPSSTSR